MDNFEYYVPTKIYFGKDEELKVGSIIKEYGFKNILFHYGKSSISKTGLYEKVINSLNKEKISFIELGGVEPNPKLSLVMEGIKLCKENNIDFILAVGGGSVIDSAKAIAAGYKNDCNPWMFSTKKRKLEKSLSIGTILTIAASGSEMSDSCVITNEDYKMKRGFNSDFNRPLFSILNPELTYTVSPYQTSCGIVDIIMHTFERLFTKTKETSLIDMMSLSLIKNVMLFGKRALTNPYDYEARATLMWASSLSHNGLTRSGKDSMLMLHQIEHEISGMFDNVSHAAGLSATLHGFLKVLYKYDLKKFSDMMRFLFDINEENNEKASLFGIKMFDDYLKEIKMPTRLKDIHVFEDSFDALVSNLTNNGRNVIHGYIDLDKEKALEILTLSK